MIFNTKNQIESQKLLERAKWLASKGKRVELKEIRLKRTIKQNAYLHLILSYFALEYGETIEFTKQEIFKKYVNPDTFKTTRVNPKSGKERESWKSSAIINTKEMTDAIDRFKNWSIKVAGIKLPDADDQIYLDYIQNEIEKNKQWL